MKKKTILFFSRSELVHLYAMLTEHLVDHFNIIHIAYSKTEAEILKNKYSINSNFILKDEIKLNITDSYPTNDLIQELDDLFLTETDGRFNLNASIQSDRTFQGMSYEDCIEITANYYNVWKKILNLQFVDFFVHEPTSLMMNHIVSLLCKKQKSIYSTHIMVPGENDYNFIMLDFDNGNPTEINSFYNSLSKNDLEINRLRIDNFLRKFRSTYDVYFDFSGIDKYNFKLFIKLFIGVIKDEMIKYKSLKKLNAKIDNIEIFLINNKLNKRRLLNIFSYRKIVYDDYNSEENFYFYPLHLEPEAVVLYWADGVYTNQIKLIENIAAQLPAGIYLYVKDHPHLLGYRNVDDYVRLKNIPNLRLLAPNISGKNIIKDSLGVITLNGTAGFEGLLLNKHVIIFGNSFYSISDRVKVVDNIKNFRKIIYELRNVKYEDDDELRKFILSYLLSTKIGFTNYFGGVAEKLGIDTRVNNKSIAEGLIVFFENFEIKY